MNDLIDRQAAIDALNDEYHGMISDESMKIYQIVEWLNTLPSAQRTGRWIVDRDSTGCMYGRCTSCGMKQYAGRTKFCPNCGAKMEVEK